MNGARMPWALLAIFVGLTLTTCALALQAIVTFPTACVAALAGTLILLPPKGGVVSRHYVLLAVVGTAALAVTWLWQRADS